MLGQDLPINGQLLWSLLQQVSFQLQNTHGSGICPGSL